MAKKTKTVDTVHSSSTKPTTTTIQKETTMKAKTIAKETTKAPKPVKKSYSYFDLDKFEKVTVEKEIPPFTPKTADEVLALVSADNTILVKSVNAFLKRSALRAVKLEVAALGGDTAIVSALAKPFRAMPPWSVMYELGPDGKPLVDSEGNKVVNRKAQTASIYDFIRANPSLVASIKQATLEAAANEDDDDETKETTED